MGPFLAVIAPWFTVYVSKQACENGGTVAEMITSAHLFDTCYRPTSFTDTLRQLHFSSDTDQANYTFLTCDAHTGDVTLTSYSDPNCHTKVGDPQIFKGIANGECQPTDPDQPDYFWSKSTCKKSHSTAGMSKFKFWPDQIGKEDPQCPADDITYLELFMLTNKCLHASTNDSQGSGMLKCHGKEGTMYSYTDNDCSDGEAITASLTANVCEKDTAMMMKTCSVVNVGLVVGLSVGLVVGLVVLCLCLVVLIFVVVCLVKMRKREEPYEAVNEG